VHFRSGTDEIRGYLAVPRGAQRGPGVIMVHENLGIPDHRQDVTRRLAAAGYATLTVDLFSRIGGLPPQDYTTTLERRAKAYLAARDEQSIPDLYAGMDFLSKLDSVDPERIGSIGFCMGGGIAITWALENEKLKACVVFYGPPVVRYEYRPDGRVLNRIPRAPQLKCPFQGHFGEADEVISLEDVALFEGGLRKSGHHVEIYTYPGAVHAYHDDTLPMYHKEASELSWARTLEFFGRWL